MGNTCSSGQTRKNKDNISRLSEESASYQVATELRSNEQKSTEHYCATRKSNSNTAGQCSEKEIHCTTVDNTSSFETKTSATSEAVQNVATDDTKINDKDTTTRIPRTIENFPEELQNLLIGHSSLQTRKTIRCRKIVLYVCAADSYDSHLEKCNLHTVVYPELRALCEEQGFELHLVNLHWESSAHIYRTNVFTDLCLAELARQEEIAYIVPIILLNNSIPTLLTPHFIKMEHYKTLSNVINQEEREFLTKWYSIDNNNCSGSTNCYLNQIAFKAIATQKDKLSEVNSTIHNILLRNLSQNATETYFTTPIEVEIQNTVLKNPEMAKRALWINKVCTPVSKLRENLSDNKHLMDRLDTIHTKLKEHLNEKHIGRFTVKAKYDERLNPTQPDHAKYIEQVVKHLNTNLTKILQSIMDEHKKKMELKPCDGFDTTLQAELKEQTLFYQDINQDNYVSTFDSLLTDIKKYIVEKTTTYPFIVSGVSGSGKTTVLKRVVAKCLEWQPTAILVYRFANITAVSSSTEQMLNSIVNQCSFLAYGHQFYGDHTVHSYETALATLFESIAQNRHLIVVVDGYDETRCPAEEPLSLRWIIKSSQLPTVKLILSVASDTALQNQHFTDSTSMNVHHLPELSAAEAKNLIHSSIRNSRCVDDDVQQRINDLDVECVSPIHCQVVAWQVSQPFGVTHPLDLTSNMEKCLQILQQVLDEKRTSGMLSIMIAAKYGVCDSEMLDMLAMDEQFHNSEDKDVPYAEVCLLWSHLSTSLSQFLHWKYVNPSGSHCVQIRSNLLQSVIRRRFHEQIQIAHKTIFQYFQGAWSKESAKTNVARMPSESVNKCKRYRIRSVNELPFQYNCIHQQLEESTYLTDPKWIYEKTCISNCHQLLEDINLVTPIRHQFTKLLKHFFETHAALINTDGRQLFTHLSMFLEQHESEMKSSKNTMDFLNYVQNPISITGTLFVINTSCIINTQTDGVSSSKSVNLLVRLPETDDFLASVSTEANEISVWNIHDGSQVRCVQGIPQPINLLPINTFQCIVLCGRELRIYDLNTGEFVSKLKGMMNQKMAYFGIHDRNHLVALSRNRMYVNLMNIETGDCVTTFKAGEDRFLNSLLVSGNGRILVCGDETQKPFPLLVWNLQSRKLLYDLRIPCHDFITSMADITYEGNFVCCACHEIDEPNPNFIVVYDLQSGTLFKKWKPECDTVALAISSPASCVISSLTDARILVWDLTTGNCRWTLEGHTTGVTILKLDATGNFFLSAAIDCNKDKSIRVWDLNQGHLVAVYTPKFNVTAYELSSNCRFLVLGIENQKNICVLELRSSPMKQTTVNDESVYGLKENCGKIFDLNEAKHQ